jgi:predicted anti-sigma-YlaC factor YlaD
MKCIREDLIQKYIDRETSDKEEAFVTNHMSACKKCQKKMTEMQQKADHIKRLISLLEPERISVPMFEKTMIRRKTFYQQYKHLILDASAACIIGLGLLLFRKPADEAHIVMSYEFLDDYNANLPVSEQEMVITIIDSEGKLTQY